jgi:hypothetical protein
MRQLDESLRCVRGAPEEREDGFLVLVSLDIGEKPEAAIPAPPVCAPSYETYVTIVERRSTLSARS